MEPDPFMRSSALKRTPPLASLVEVGEKEIRSPEGNKKRKPSSPADETSRKPRLLSLDIESSEDEATEETSYPIEGIMNVTKLLRSVQTLVRAKKSVTQKQLNELEVLATQALDDYQKAVKENIELGGRLKENRRCYTELLGKQFDPEIYRETVKETLKSIEIPKVSRPPSYADMARIVSGSQVPQVTGPPKPRNTFLIYPKNDKQVSEETRDNIKKTIDPVKMGLRINRISKIRSGGVAMDLADDRDVECLKKALGDTYEVKKPKRRLPKVLIYDVPRELKEEELVQKVFDQNLKAQMDEQDFVRNFRPLFRTGPREKDVVNWVVEVSPRLRSILSRESRVYIGWRNCRVVDHVIVIRCYKCQRYGHSSKECQSKDECCSHCGKTGHAFKDCKDRQKPATCVNCFRNGKDYHHSANHRDCESWTSERLRIAKLVDYTE